LISLRSDKRQEAKEIRLGLSGLWSVVVKGHSLRFRPGQVGL